MNVIDVTPRPAAVSAVVRFLQSRVMTVLGILFILTAFKWGTLLFVVHQYETAIITRFGKIVRTITTPGLKMKLPVIDKVQRFDKRLKRSKYNPAVAEKIIERMSSERHQIAARFRSEGRGEAANISGQKESDVASISSTATKNALEIEGKADAEAAAIYAAAFNPPDAQEFYSFLRSLDVMRAAFEKDTTAVISTNSDLGRMLKSMAEAVASPKPAR